MGRGDGDTSGQKFTCFFMKNCWIRTKNKQKSGHGWSIKNDALENTHSTGKYHCISCLDSVASFTTYKLQQIACLVESNQAKLDSIGTFMLPLSKWMLCEYKL